MATLSTTFSSFTKFGTGDIGGTEDWGTESNAQTSNNVRATYSSTSPEPWVGDTAILSAQELTGKVPAGATVNGITITIERRVQNGGTVGVWTDGSVRLTKDGTNPLGDDKANSGEAYTTTDVAEVYGGAADLWGTTWTAAEVNASTFGVLFRALSTLEGLDSDGPEVDSIVVSIDYTAAATTPTRSMMGVGI